MGRLREGSTAAAGEAPGTRRGTTFATAVLSEGRGLVEGAASPRGNKILASLSEDCWRAISPHLRPWAADAGTVLFTPATRSPFVYFPVSGAVARYVENGDDQAVSFALCGSESIVGVAMALGGPPAASAVALCPCTFYRGAASAVWVLVDRDAEFRAAVLGYARYFIDELILHSLCFRYHKIDQQLCTWILSALDRMQGAEMRLTQAMIARLLGVRREGVTEAINRLVRLGVVEIRKSYLRVVDRAGLEGRACSCYVNFNNLMQKHASPPSTTPLALA